MHCQYFPLLEFYNTDWKLAYRGKTYVGCFEQLTDPMSNLLVWQACGQLVGCLADLIV